MRPLILFLLALSVCTPELAPASPGVVQCVIHGDLPDARCTPGTIEPITLQALCRTSTKARRNVSHAEHVAAFLRYGIAYPQPTGAYEVDHLVALELGGTNAPANLWPQPAPAFHHKDALENWLHKRVCAGDMELSEAQRRIATDWVSAWNEMNDSGGE